MATLFRLFLLLLPVLEIATFILVAEAIGIAWTMAAVLASMLAGVLVIRILGGASLADVRLALARQEPPVGAMMRGAGVLLAGLLLILPGFLTDLLALALLVPALRGRLGGIIWRRLGPTAGQPRGRPAGSPEVIDGEFREVDPTDRSGSALPPTVRPARRDPFDKEV
jgi:UPF0716 protein FxsA